MKAESEIGSVGDVPRNESEQMTPPTVETESSPQPLSPAAAEGKRQSDTLRAKARGKHCNASRAVKREADSEEIELVDRLAEHVEKPKSKGGRPPGSKSRHPALIAVERVLRSINRKNQQWMDSRSEHFYIRIIQLAAKLIPQSAVDGATGEKRDVTLQLRFAERELICREVGESLQPLPSADGPTPQVVAKTDNEIIQEMFLAIKVTEGDPATDEVKARLMDKMAEKLADRAEKRRQEREEEKADELKLRAEQRRERMYAEGRWQNLGGRFSEWDN